MGRAPVSMFFFGKMLPWQPQYGTEGGEAVNKTD
jgi:hypothetical protein